MKVYVVEGGIYENRGITGVYATLELAKASVRKVGPEGWTHDKFGWDNGLDWDEAAGITEYEVEGEALDERPRPEPVDAADV